MRKISILLFIVLFLNSISVLANVNWYQEANSGLNLPGGTGYIGYGSNINNLLTDQTYSQCSISGSTYTPVATDLDGNGIVDIITSPSNRLELYTLDCEFITDLALGENVRAIPVIVNFDEDANQEIVVLLSGNVEIYEFDSDISSFVEIENIDYSATVSDLDYITCPRSTEHTCIALNQGSNEVYLFDFDTDTVTELTNEIPQSLLNIGSITQGLSTSTTLGADRWRIPFCLSQGSTTNYYTCHTLDVNGENESISTGNLGSASFSIDQFYYNSVFYAKMGNALRIFANLDYQKSGNPRHQAKIFDSAYTELVGVQASDSYNKSSNWMVADYDKDGVNDACILINDTPTTYFRCWDSGFNQIENINVTGTIDISKSCVLADFNGSASTLGLATMEGIFYENEAGTSFNEFYDTGETSSGYRSGIVVSTASTGSPAYVYADSTSGFIVRDSSATSACGNDICEIFENAFSCPSDCSINVTGALNETGAGCVTNQDCESGLCEAGFCVLKPGNYQCESGDECLSGICTNNICARADYWDSIDQAKTNLYGDDSNTNNFISLFIMTAVAIGVIIMGRNFASLLIAGLMFIILGFFFAVVGWLSVFIAFGLIVGVLALIILTVVLRMSSE